MEERNKKWYIMKKGIKGKLRNEDTDKKNLTER